MGSVQYGEIFAVPVDEANYLVHAPLHGVSALLNRAALGALDQGDLPDLSAELASEAPAPELRAGPVDPWFLGIIPTRACNAACAYCGFGATPCGETMDPQLAVAGVDWMTRYSVRAGRRTLDVHFFGGEPLMAPAIVETVVHRTRLQAAGNGLAPCLEIATNGIYSDEWARFVGGYFESVSLSLDGPANIQDRHRPLAGGRGSFDRVARTARILSRSSARFCIRVCVADDNVEQLEETAEWFCREFQPAAICFETLQSTPQAERAGLHPPDPFVFAQRLVRACRRVREWGVEAVYSAADTAAPRLTFCPVGKDALILHPDGRITACYMQDEDWRARGLDFDLGRIAPGAGLVPIPGAVERVRRAVVDKPRCGNCFCRWSCAGGCHVTHTFPECPANYDDFCVQTRLITACFLLEMLDRQALADGLLNDLGRMRNLAFHSSDRVGRKEAPSA